MGGLRQRGFRVAHLRKERPARGNTVPILCADFQVNSRNLTEPEPSFWRGHFDLEAPFLTCHNRAFGLRGAYLESPAWCDRAGPSRREVAIANAQPPRTVARSPGTKRPGDGRTGLGSYPLAVTGVVAVLLRRRYNRVHEGETGFTKRPQAMTVLDGPDKDPTSKGDGTGWKVKARSPPAAVL